jgi:Domain of unknown function (DU1801)
VNPIRNPAVARVFEAYPPSLRRKLIFATAAATEGVGEIEETLKWGEPAYVTSQSKSGSTIRIDCKKSDRTRYAMYFHCQTHLVETFRTLFPNDFKFEGNRSIVFDEDDVVPYDALAVCVAAALTYHRRKNAFQTDSRG